MEDSFRVRVDKVFGSLSSSSSSSSTATQTQISSSSLSSLWCLTDDEIQRNEWNRNKDSPELETERDPDEILERNQEGRDANMDFFKSEIEKDLDDLDDDETEEVEKKSKQKPDGFNDEEWDIKNSIGLDCTLDFEEEEDKYDKVAVGKENAGDRLYMKDVVNDHGVGIDCGNEFPNSFVDVARDPRANHIAAKIRLKEDAEAAKKMDLLRVTETDSPAIGNGQIKRSEDNNPKSILKRKDDQLDSKSNNSQFDSKSQKRVRFDPECKDCNDEEPDGIKDIQMEADSTEETVVYRLPPDYPSGIPDYMRNPSKYTRYTLGSSDVDEESNRRACMDFLQMLRRSKGTESQANDVPADLSKPVPFVPKKRTGDATMMDNYSDSKQNLDDANKDSKLRKGMLVGIPAADDDHDTEATAMEEDKPETAADGTNSQIRARQYRARTKLETDDLEEDKRETTADGNKFIQTSPPTMNKLETDDFT